MAKKTGRKKIEDRSKVKIQVPIYLRNSIIEAAGGKDEIRKRIYQFLDQHD
jgi:hypothetical protein